MTTKKHYNTRADNSSNCHDGMCLSTAPCAVTVEHLTVLYSVQCTVYSVISSDRCSPTDHSSLASCLS